jgi:hypothetical protein
MFSNSYIYLYGEFMSESKLYFRLVVEEEILDQFTISTALHTIQLATNDLDYFSYTFI